MTEETQFVREGAYTKQILAGLYKLIQVREKGFFSLFLYKLILFGSSEFVKKIIERERKRVRSKVIAVHGVPRNVN